MKSAPVVTELADLRDAVYVARAMAGALAEPSVGTLHGAGAG